MLAAALPFVAGSDPFAARLWRALPASPGNVVLSPTSIRAALGLLTPALGPSSRPALAQTFGVPTEGLDAEARRAADALRTMERGGEVTAANASFFTVPVSPDYARTAREAFGATVESLPPGDAGVRRINAWASANTKGRIPAIIDRLDPLMRMVLANAITFDAKWAMPFSPYATRPMPFAAPTGSRPVPTMFGSRLSIPYAKGSDFAVVALPYGGGRFWMAIVLPDEGDPRRLLADDAWLKALRGGRAEPVDLSLPRFTVRSDPRVQEALGALGLGPLFDQADLHPAVPSGSATQIGPILQRVFIEVGEEGTKAAVVTTLVAGGGGPSRQDPPREFRVDRPFAFAIEDVRTGEIPFEGVVREP